jgi:thioredoxin reductase (NADPH)
MSHTDVTLYGTPWCSDCSGKHIIPTLVFEDGSTLVEPSNAEPAAKLGLQTVAKNRFYGLMVVSSGPAGLTAALYAAREGIEDCRAGTWQRRKR